jgi:hypothetical protein
MAKEEEKLEETETFVKKPVKKVKQPKQECGQDEVDIVGFVTKDKEGTFEAFSTKRNFEFKVDLKG